MKKASRLLTLAFITACIATFYGCEKDPEIEIPTVTTTVASLITAITAEAGGTVTNDGGAEVTSRGICWNNSENPTTLNSKTSDGKGTGSFSSSLPLLTPGTKYYVRAYATNSAGTGYGNQVSFTTDESIKSPSVPTLTTIIVTSITFNTAVSGGEIFDDNGGDIIEMGVCWSTSENPRISDSRTSEEPGNRVYISNLIGLTPGTTYYVRAYAVNSAGVAYGIQRNFTTLFSQDAKKADFPGGVRFNAAGFSIGTKVYMGLGYDDGDNSRKDFWAWDQETNVWAMKADFPGSISGNFVCFSIGTKGYIGTGNFISTYSSTYDFWEYDPATNIWTKKASLPVTPARGQAVGFSIGAKGYIGIGGKYGLAYYPYFNDFWEWDQATNEWTKKADFPGNTRAGAVGFSVGNKGYIGTGYDGTSYSNEFWEWDQATNTWTRKANYGGAPRGYGVGFSIGNKGYIGTGYDGTSYCNDFWEWDQATDEWTRKADFKGDARALAVGVSIGNKGYIGTGSGYIIYAFQDFWEYDTTLKK